MALTVETGMGVVGADSYASLVSADALLSSLGNVAWAAADLADKEVALRRAALYLDTHHLSGSPSLVDQGMGYPFIEVEDVAADMRQLVRANIMLSPLALDSDLLIRSPDTAQVLSSTDKVGEISESRTYVDNSDSVVLLNGFDVSFLGSILSRFSGRSGLVIGRRIRS
jgi:hypothetical protein